MEHFNDSKIIGDVLAGNHHAYRYLVDRYKDRAFNLAFRICGNREEAEEVAQDAFLKAYRSLSSFRMKSAFSTWLYRIVYNTAVSLIRSRKKAELSIEDFPADATDFMGHDTSEEEAEREYRNALVGFALQKLNSEERGLITLHYFEEMSTDEISEVTGISRSNVKVRLFRARQKMLAIFEKTEMKKLIYHE